MQDSTSSDNLRSQLDALLQQSPFVSALGMSIEEADPQQGRLVMLLPAAPQIERVRGSAQIHGGVIASLIDTAACFALAMRTLQPPPTVNMRVDFLRAARQSTLRAVAVVRRQGRAFGIADVEVLDDSGEMVALGRATFALGG